MLTGLGKEGCIAILRLLPDDEIMTLAQTVTTRQLVLCSRQDAVDAIITFTTDAVELLKRKKMKREYLFRYLAENSIPISPAAEKNHLVQTILGLWGSDDSQTEQINPGAQPITIEPTYGGNPPTVQHSQIPPNLAAYNPHVQPIKIEPTNEENVPPPQQNQVNTAVNANSISTHSIKREPLNVGSLPSQQNQITTAIGAYQTVSVKNPTEEHQQKLCLAFARWFYNLLNAQNPQSGIVSTEDFGSHHFYTDCRLLLVCATPQVSKSEYTGSDISAQRLRALVLEEQLILNPNLTPEGIRGKSEPHGLIQVLVCGTVHQTQTPIGIFEQQFGLIQEPVTNNWKIKYTNLKLRTQHSNQMPTLEQTRDVLAIENS